MAEILQKAFQNVIDERGEMEDKKSQNAPTIDSVIGTGPDVIQPPKTEVKEVVSHEGADAQEG
jgi:nucleoside-triphosphatase THEP1